MFLKFDKEVASDEKMLSTKPHNLKNITSLFVRDLWQLN